MQTPSTGLHHAVPKLLNISLSLSPFVLLSWPIASAMITESIGSETTFEYIHGHQVRAVESESITLLFPWARLSGPRFSPISPLESPPPPLEIGHRYRRGKGRGPGTRTRREDSRVSPPGYASSFRPQRTRRWRRRRVWDHRGPLHFRSPFGWLHHRPFIRSFAVPFRARLLGDSRGRAFSSPRIVSLHPPLEIPSEKSFSVLF